MSCEYCNRVCGVREGYLELMPIVPKMEELGGLRYDPSYKQELDGDYGQTGWLVELSFCDQDSEDRPVLPIKFCPWCARELGPLSDEAYNMINEMVGGYLADELDIDEVMQIIEDHGTGWGFTNEISSSK